MSINGSTEMTPDIIIAPVPEDSLDVIKRGANFAVEQAAETGRPLGLAGEYPVYRATTQLVIGLLTRQHVDVAQELATRLADAGNEDAMTDVFAVAAEEEHRVDFKHTKPGNLPSRDERFVGLAYAAGATAHAIAAIALGHESAPQGITAARKVLDDPETARKIGTISEHTLHTLLSELEAEQAESEAA